jgi:uncharacterized protein
MGMRGWTRFASGASSRALKYRHLLDEAVGLTDGEISLLAVLMLRGPQTLGELKGRSERLHRFDSLEEVQQTLDGLSERELVVRLARRTGQKEERYAQLLGGDGEQPAPPATDEEPAPVATTGQPVDLDRLTALERRVDELERTVAAVRDRLPSGGFGLADPNP